MKKGVNMTSKESSTGGICLKEYDIIRLLEGYLDYRGFHMTLDTLERETDIINAEYPEVGLVLRRLILDGKWTKAIQYIQGLTVSGDDIRYMVFEIMKQKYIEMICVYEELGNELYEDLGNAIALCFTEMSSYCSCPVEYESLKKLASLTKLSQDPNYENWNPLTSRRQCFQTIIASLLESPGLRQQCKENLMDHERLIDLLVKGILYESSAEYDQKKEAADLISLHFAPFAQNSEVTDSNLNVSSLLQNLKNGTFNSQILLGSENFQVDYISKPRQKEKWTEVILQNSNDSSEDMLLNAESKLIHPDFERGELEEMFWNKKIKHNLILDAPEILKRADDVIARWEKLNSKTASLITDINVKKNHNNKNISQIVRIGSTNDMAGILGNKDVLNSNTSDHYSKLRNPINICSVTKKVCNCLPECDDEEQDNTLFQHEVDENRIVLPFSKISLRQRSDVKKDVQLNSSLHLEGGPSASDLEQNVRDMLSAKMTIREKLLQILKGNENESKINANASLNAYADK